VKQLKYRPNVDGSVAGGVDTPAMKVEARAADAEHRSKSEGAIVVTIMPKDGFRLGGDGATPTKVEVVGTEKVTVPAGQAQVSVAEGLTAKRELRIPIAVGEKTPGGEQLVTIKVTFQGARGMKKQEERTVEFRVPVVVR
jgi:hypothetical protein